LKLLELAKKNLQEFIGVREALELISNTQQTPLSYVATFLISQNFEANISTYDADKYYVIHSNDNWNWGQFEYTSSILSALADNDKYKAAYVFDTNDIPENLKDTYWKRSELYSLNVIKDLSLDCYLRAEDIKNIIGSRTLNLDEFKSNENFSDSEVKKLLKSGIPTYIPSNVDKFSLIDDFVNSITDFFECDFDKGLIIHKVELKELLSKFQIIIKGFNDYSFQSSQLENSNIWDENYLAIVASDLFSKTEDIFVSIESFKDEGDRFHIEEDFSVYSKILLMNEYFSVVEAACLISKDDPNKVQALIDNNDLSYDAWHYGEHIQAMKVIKDAISINRLDMANEGISKVSLQVFLFEKNYIVAGFNDNLPMYKGIVNISALGANYHTLLEENEFLRQQLEKKEDEIQELITKLKIQTSESTIIEESKLKSTRAENNVAKLILTLSSMAKIDVTKPYSPYESLRVEADLLGIDKFPSDENIAGWLKKANNQNPN
jgi:hypothetical protein